ncbi:MAG: hypothetical protein K6U11_13670 [bacterium]|nr:hypothetical protein [bacterium]
MKEFSLKYVSCAIIFTIAVNLLASTQASAQFLPYVPPYAAVPFAAVPFYPYVPPYPVFAPIYPTIPLFDPYLSLPTTATRAAAATIVLLPTTPTVTAAAPLGTLSLTPTTLVLLTLFLSLEE